MIKVIGIGEYAISNNEEDIIKTFALGSCVALAIYCPKVKKLGMVHIALPDSTIRKNNNTQEGYFADLATPMLFEKVCNGFFNFKMEYKVYMFGGALSKNNNDVFNVGLKNIIAITNILSKNNISFDYSNTGGYYSRTVEVDVKTGTPNVSLQLMNI